MIVQQTLMQLRHLKLDGMAHAFEEQLGLPSAQPLSFEDRFALLVEREHAYRDERRLKRLLGNARLKYSQASLEDLDTRTRRGLDQRLITTLAHGEWLTRGYWADWCGQNLSLLRAAAESVSPRQNRALRAPAARARRAKNRSRRRLAQTSPCAARQARRIGTRRLGPHCP